MLRIRQFPAGDEIRDHRHRVRRLGIEPHRCEHRVLIEVAVAQVSFAQEVPGVQVGRESSPVEGENRQRAASAFAQPEQIFLLSRGEGDVRQERHVHGRRCAAHGRASHEVDLHPGGDIADARRRPSHGVARLKDRRVGRTTETVRERIAERQDLGVRRAPQTRPHDRHRESHVEEGRQAGAQDRRGHRVVEVEVRPHAEHVAFEEGQAEPGVRTQGHIRVLVEEVQDEVVRGHAAEVRDLERGRFEAEEETPHPEGFGSFGEDRPERCAPIFVRPDAAAGHRGRRKAADHAGDPFLEGKDERFVTRNPFAQVVPAVLRAEIPGLVEVRIEAQGHAALPEHEQFRHEVRERLCRSRPASHRHQRHHDHEPRDGSSVHLASHRVSAPVALKVRPPVGRGKVTR